MVNSLQCVCILNVYSILCTRPVLYKAQLFPSLHHLLILKPCPQAYIQEELDNDPVLLLIETLKLLLFQLFVRFCLMLLAYL